MRTGAANDILMLHNPSPRHVTVSVVLYFIQYLQTDSDVVGMVNPDRIPFFDLQNVITRTLCTGIRLNSCVLRNGIKI